MMKLRFALTATASLCLLGCHQPTQPGSDTGATLAATASATAAIGETKTTASGLKYQVLKQGSGTASPKASDSVKVHYHGTLLDGTVFDSSVERDEPVEFPLNQVIKGWTEGLQLMVVGEKTRFWIPAELAYGSNPRPGAPFGMLVFDVELLGINE